MNRKMWWGKLFSGFKRKNEHLLEEEVIEEKYIMGKCIGCGQCDKGKAGCPVKVKIKIKKKRLPDSKKSI